MNSRRRESRPSVPCAPEPTENTCHSFMMDKETTLQVHHTFENILVVTYTTKMCNFETRNGAIHVLNLETTPGTLGFTYNLGPVVRKPISANPVLNFNPGFFFICSNVFSRINFSILFRASNHPIVDKKNWAINLLFKLSFLNFHFALSPGLS